MIKLRRMRWARQVGRMEEMRNAYKILVGKPEGKRLFIRPRRRWQVISELILEKWGWRVWIGFIWLRAGTGDRFL
jgi:hypothetical protein